MNLVNLRPILAPIIGAAICFGVSQSGAALKDPTIAQFAARAVSPSDTADMGPVEIRITRWSTDQDLQDLRAALNDKSPSSMVLPAFRRAQPEAGIVLMPGMQGLGERSRIQQALTFQFARQIDSPSGSQIVIATDHHFRFGEPPVRHLDYGATIDKPETGTLADPAPEPEFTLLDIRFGPDGNGVGKMAPAAKVAYNATKKIFEIENYAAEPVRLTAVKSTKP
jgi:hypothetical protein